MEANTSIRVWWHVPLHCFMEFRFTARAFLVVYQIMMELAPINHLR